MKGQRAPGPRQVGYQWAYIFTAVRPATGEDFTLVLPTVSAKVMDLFLAQFAVPGTHGRLIFAFAYLAAAAFTALALAGHRRGLGRALRAVALALRGARP